MNVRFACPACERPAGLQLPGPADWQCRQCDHLVALSSQPKEGALQTCALCSNAELYKKKDFPHGLGMTILLAACVGSAITYGLYHQWWTWVILIGSAAFDGLLYLCVGDVVVCYRCNAHYRGLLPSAAHRPFELGVAERYRQERLRRQQLQPAKKIP